MHSTQTFGPSLPAVDPFGAPHFTADYEEPPKAPPAWTGDPSSVPLASVTDPEVDAEARADELDQTIFAALVSH